MTCLKSLVLNNVSEEACGTGLARQFAGPSGRSITKAIIQIVSKMPRSPKTAALGASLVFSALLTAAALRLPDHHWLGLISFLPLFVIIRSLHTPAAVLAGGFWGGCFYLFGYAGPTPAVDTVVGTGGSSAWLLELMIVIPAIYVGLAARPAQPIGFKLLTLGLGWTLVEAVLHIHNPSSSQDGLLTDSQGEAPRLNCLASLILYISTAFLVACANASLVGILHGARPNFPACRSLAGLPRAEARAPLQLFPVIQSWTLRQAYPRAPPIQVVAASGFRVGDAHRLLTQTCDVLKRVAEFDLRNEMKRKKVTVPWVPMFMFHVPGGEGGSIGRSHLGRPGRLDRT